jgi:hypothetical protein
VLDTLILLVTAELGRMSYGDANGLLSLSREGERTCRPCEGEDGRVMSILGIEGDGKGKGSGGDMLPNKAGRGLDVMSDL